MTASEIVCRHAGGALIDTPHLHIPSPRPTGHPWRWAATLWQDALQPDGWAAMQWQPAERGWTLPATIALGDVVEFGIAWHQPNRANQHVVRWYGWIHRITAAAVLLTGPYPHPYDAHAAALPFIDEVRLDQLAPIEPTLAELERWGIE